MTLVKINAITVPADSGDELARRFAARAGAVDDQDGFEGFELLKPTDERTTWLVIARRGADGAVHPPRGQGGGVKGGAESARLQSRAPLGRGTVRGRCAQAGRR